jgi:GNAT superfamily N-acetyltransferase
MNAIQINRVTELPDGLDLLIEESLSEGCGMLKRLNENWLAGTNTFSLNGEAYFEARRNGRLVGVGGLNRDPYTNDESAGRLRHMYVLQSERRNGVGRMLVAAVLKHAQGKFNIVRLRSTIGESGAIDFYERLGFRPIAGDQYASHQIEVTG